MVTCSTLKKSLLVLLIVDSDNPKTNAVKDILPKLRSPLGFGDKQHLLIPIIFLSW